MSDRRTAQPPRIDPQPTAPPAGSGLVATGNRLLLWLADRALARRQRAEARQWLASAPRPNGDRRGTLLLAWGRMGDSLLAHAFARTWRDWLPRPIAAITRPEAAPGLAGAVDELMHWHDGAPSPEARALLSRRYEVALGDLHLFHGGALPQQLLAATDAAHRFAYAGHLPDRASRWPDRVQVIPSLPEPARRSAHLFAHLDHYHRAVAALIGRAPIAWPATPSLPDLTGDGGALRDLADTVVCLAGSSQRKKEWPFANWLELWRRMPQQSFALIGLGDTPGGLPDHVRDLRNLPLSTALRIATGARAFVGVDSGPTHAAALAAVPTVVLLPQPERQRFFPYPADWPQQPRVVTAAAYEPCAGCDGICRHASLLRIRREGYPCLRAIAVEAVQSELEGALAGSCQRPPAAVAYHSSSS